MRVVRTVRLGKIFGSRKRVRQGRRVLQEMVTGRERLLGRRREGRTNWNLRRKGDFEKD